MVRKLGSNGKRKGQGVHSNEMPWPRKDESLIQLSHDS